MHILVIKNGLILALKTAKNREEFQKDFSRCPYFIPLAACLQGCIFRPQNTVPAPLAREHYMLIRRGEISQIKMLNLNLSKNQVILCISTFYK